MKKIILIAFNISLYSCQDKNPEQNNNVINDINSITLTKDQLNNSNIKVQRIENKKISKIIKLNGKIDVPPQNLISISIPLGGYIKSTKLLPGMHVKKGEILGILEDQQYIQLQQDYLTTKAKLLYAEAEYNRQMELNKSKASSDKVFQQSEMEFKTQKIAYMALAEKLKLININPQTVNENNISKNITIYSPIDGYVSFVNVNVGKYVNPSDVLFELIDPKDIHLNLTVFEKDLEELAIGQKLIAYTNNQTKQIYTCEIILISKNLSEERTAEVHCHFDNYNQDLIPGMYMNAEIKIESKLVPTLPVEAVVQFEGKNFIFLEQNNNQFQMTEIQIGIEENGNVEIINANNLLNENIVTTGAYTLLMTLKNKTDE